MKNFVLVCLVWIMALPAWSADELDQRLKLNLWGFAQTAYVENAEPDEFKLTNLRLLGSLDGQQFGVGFAFNFADLQESDSNWLRQLYGKVELTDSLELRVGRILHSVGNGNDLPGPFLLETVRFPRSSPWKQYGTGIQARWENEDWLVIADVTGDSSVTFNDSRSLQDPEFSSRIKHTFRNQERELGYLAGAVQLTQDVCYVGLEYQWKPIKPLTLRGGVFGIDASKIEGFLLAAYRPKQANWLEFHTMLDQTSDATQSSWTNGLRVIGEHDRWAVTLDYETALEGQRPGQFLARINVVFGHK